MPDARLTDMVNLTSAKDPAVYLALADLNRAKRPRRPRPFVFLRRLPDRHERSSTFRSGTPLTLRDVRLLINRLASSALRLPPQQCGGRSRGTRSLREFLMKHALSQGATVACFGGGVEAPCPPAPGSSHANISGPRRPFGRRSCSIALPPLACWRRYAHDAFGDAASHSAGA